MVDARTGLPTRAAPAASPPRDEHARHEQTKAFCLAAAKSLSDDKCQDVVVLDLRGRSQITDFFVIASGSSDRQIRSAAEHIVENAPAQGVSLWRSNLDDPKPNWIVLDFVDAVVHVFIPEARLYYDLEMLWGDAPRLQWGGPAPAEPPSPDPDAKPASRNRAGLTDADVLPGRPRRTDDR